MSLTGILSTAVSGLALNAGRVSASANNLANAHTPGYRAQEVEARSVTTGDGRGAGVQAVLRTPDGAIGGQEQHSDVDIATEFARMIQAKTAYKAGLATIRTADEMHREIVDIKA